MVFSTQAVNHPPVCPENKLPSTPPPSYIPSSQPVPSYAIEPSSDEESLEVAARPQTPAPRGEFTARAGNITVLLHEQEFGAGIPTYRQNAIIKGHVELGAQAAVIEVSITLEGRQKWAIAGVGSQERVLFSEKHQLWVKPSLAQENAYANAPHTLDFQIPFPLKFIDKAHSDPQVVPPSFETRFSEKPGISVRNEYTLITVVVTAQAGPRSKHESPILPIFLNYRPRSRPYLPIPNDLLPFFSTLKTAPEEWHQVISSVPCKDGSQKPLDCHLFIPRAQIYALRDTIPFHLQLRGSVESLRLFLGMPATEQRHVNTCPGSPGPPSATAPGSLRALAQKSQSRDSNANYSPVVRVYLRRQISVEVKGFRAYQDVVIGEGKVKQVEYPPQWSPAGVPSKNTHVDEGKEDYSLEWEGQVRCNDNIAVPSFVSGGLFVRDYIAVHLRPSDLRTAAHIEHHHAHTVRLVTDKYRDVHPADAQA